MGSLSGERFAGGTHTAAHARGVKRNWHYSCRGTYFPYCFAAWAIPGAPVARS